MKLHSLLLILLVCVASMVTTGCQTAAGYVGLAQDQVLPRLEPEHRASYRDALENASNNYDDKYDRKGVVYGPENPKPVPAPAPTPEPAPTPTPAPADPK